MNYCNTDKGTCISGFALPPTTRNAFLKGTVIVLISTLGGGGTKNIPLGKIIVTRIIYAEKN
jgi:hypothetical protein